MSGQTCPHAARCGGCRYSSDDYEAQLAKKHELLKGLLGTYGTVLPVLGTQPYHYRNKVIRSFGYENKKPVSGLYEAHSRTLLPVAACLLEDEGADKILRDAAEIALKQHIPPYDARTHAGLLRHMMVRAGKRSGEYLLAVVTAAAEFPGRNNFLKAILSKHPELTTVVQNVNASDTGIVLGQKGHGKETGTERVLYGPGFIRDTLCSLSFRISADSFYQVNTEGAELLYETAIGLAGLTGKESVLDAYCGVGTIGLSAAKYAGSVTGVELNRDAVRDAIHNAKANKIGNARFYQGDAGDFLLSSDRRFDTVIMDPPRSGSSPEFLSALRKAKPDTVVYISCAPEALARDLSVLTRDYRVKTIQPVDMFPFTEHVETVVLISHKQTGGA